MSCHWSPLWFCRTCVTYGMLCHAIGHPTYFLEPVWLTGCHIESLITRYFPSDCYLGKQMISLGLASILRRCLCLHTLPICNQKVLVGRLYICMCWALLQNIKSMSHSFGTHFFSLLIMRSAIELALPVALLTFLVERSLLRSSVL